MLLLHFFGFAHHSAPSSALSFSVCLCVCPRSMSCHLQCGWRISSISQQISSSLYIDDLFLFSIRYSFYRFFFLFFRFFPHSWFFLKCSKKWKMITKKNTYPTKWFSSSVNNLDEISLTFYCWYRKILRSSTCSKHRIYGWRNFFSLLFICIKLLLIYQNGSKLDISKQKTVEFEKKYLKINFPLKKSFIIYNRLKFSAINRNEQQLTKLQNRRKLYVIFKTFASKKK